MFNWLTRISDVINFPYILNVIKKSIGVVIRKLILIIDCFDIIFIIIIKIIKNKYPK